MSDWYGYCKVCTSPVTSFSSSIIQTTSTVCSATINQTYYHDGSGSLPVVSDKIYSNAAGSNLLSAGNYRISTYTYMVLNSLGVVTSIANCLRPYSSSTGTVFSGVCALSINQTYYHNGSGTYPTAGDTVYSDPGGTNVLADFYYKFNSTFVIRITGGAGIVNPSWPQNIC